MPEHRTSPVLAVARRAAVAPRAPVASVASAGRVVARAVAMPGFEMPLALSRMSPRVAWVPVAAQVVFLARAARA
jgi:hypothetical protein